MYKTMYSIFSFIIIKDTVCITDSSKFDLVEGVWF